MQIIYILLIAYVCLVPFYYFGLPIAKYFPLALIALLFVLSWVKGYMKISLFVKDKLNIYILIYTALTFLSGIGTAYYPVSLAKGVYYALTGVLVYLILSSWRLDNGPKERLLKIIVLTGFIASAYAVITLFAGKDVLFGWLPYSKSNLIPPDVFLKAGRVSSSLGNPLFLGGVLSVIFPLSAYFCLSAGAQKQKSRADYLMPASMAVIMLATILTFSVAALLGMVIFYVVYSLFLKKGHQGGYHSSLVNMFAFLGAVLACIVLYVMAINAFCLASDGNCPFDGLFGKIDFQKLANLQGISLRFDSLKSAVSSLGGKNALFGIGIGKIGTGTSAFSKVSMDNYFCLSLIENGILTTAALIFMLGVIVKRAYNKHKEALSGFLFPCAVIFLINLLFWDALNQPTMRILFWSLIGLLG
jgi:hypothetical protein